ncbi:hypothetical protein ZOSMA_418G00120 [Zostera marina]|uniref:Uncharacterized protein n=1 Tax=Zostera marina TaxID=29655 RepID=A0A0K9P2W8_ZOSMR|nr:hypothetical protein ZOSMA_418G00120 [Zostera marina]
MVISYVICNSSFFIELRTMYPAEYIQVESF